MFPELWCLNCPRKHFFQICAELSKKPNSVKTIYIYASEGSHHTFSENDMA